MIIHWLSSLGYLNPWSRLLLFSFIFFPSSFLFSPATKGGRNGGQDGWSHRGLPFLIRTPSLPPDTFFPKPHPFGQPPLNPASFPVSVASFLPGGHGWRRLWLKTELLHSSSRCSLFSDGLHVTHFSSSFSLVSGELRLPVAQNGKLWPFCVCVWSDFLFAKSISHFLFWVSIFVHLARDCFRRSSGHFSGDGLWLKLRWSSSIYFFIYFPLFSVIFGREAEWGFCFRNNNLLKLSSSFNLES